MDSEALALVLIKSQSQRMNRPIIAEGLNNVDNEVERFYELNCPTFYKKITGRQENFEQGNL